MKKLRLLSVMLLLFLGMQTVIAQSDTHTLNDRTYHLYIPESLTDAESRPLVIALHQISSSGKAMEALTGFDEAADEYGFMVAYPDSAQISWDDGRVEAGLSADVGADDVEFITSLVDELIANENVDAERVYLTGFDNGAGMAFRLACEVPGRFAKVAVYGGYLWDYHRDICPESAPAPIDLLIMGGARDTYYPITGREWDAEAGTMLVSGVGDTMNFWMERNACDPEQIGTFRVREGDIQIASYITFSDCAEGTQVTGYVIEGAGHNWPRAQHSLINPARINVTDVIAQYFMGEENWQTASVLELGEAAPPRTAREYRYYVPSSYDPDQPTPLMVVLHGHPDTAVGISLITQMNPVAEENGFIVAYPNGIGNGWYYLPGQEEQIPDEQFLRDMIDEMALDLNIDRNRVYVTGFSNGGFMTENLACNAPDVFAAFAVVGATIYQDLDEVCEGTPAVPMLLMHGTADVSVPWEGQFSMSQAGLVATGSVPETVDFWVNHNGCNAESDTRIDVPQGDEATRVGIFPFSGCDDGSTLLFYAIDGGGHNWPGNPGVIDPQIAGTVNEDIEASEEIWQFFQQYTLNN